MREESRHLLFQIAPRKRLHHARTIHEPRPEHSIRVLEHPIFQGDDDELCAIEAGTDQAANILRVAEIEGRVHFVEDVHGCRFDLQEGEDKGEGDEGSES